MKSRKMVSIILSILLVVSVFSIKNEVRAASKTIYASDIANEISSSYGTYYNLTLSEDTVFYMDQAVTINLLIGNNYDLTIDGGGTLTVTDISNVKNYIQ